MRYPPGIKPLSPDLWQVRATLQLHSERFQLRRRVRGSLDDARAVQLEMIEELRDRHERIAPPENPTLTVCARLWLAERASETDKDGMQILAASTIAKYLSDLENRILPTLGNSLVSELRPAQISPLLASSNGAAQTRRNIRTVLKGISDYAVSAGIRDTSFMPSLRIRGRHRYTEQDPNCLTASQVNAVLRSISTYWSCVVHVLALTGQRWGEVSGLLWPDIDLDAKTARIERTNWRGELQPRPKTSAGRRIIALSDPLPELLDALRRRQLATQHPGLKLGLVFPTAKGTPHAGTPLNGVLRKACAELGFPRLSPHGLRRTYNNLLRLVAEGVVVRSIVGHTDEAMTDHYSVVSLGEKRAAAGKVLELVRGGKEED